MKMGRALAAALLLAAGAAASACADGTVDEPVTGGDELVDPVKLPRAGAGNFGPNEETPSTTPSNPDGAGPLFRVAYDSPAASTLNTFFRNEAALQTDGTLTIATKKGYAGTDPQPADFHGGSFYNGGTYRYATVVSPVWSAATAFDTVTPSFEALTPPGTWIEVHVSAHVASTKEWTKEYSLGVWAHDASTVRRHSVPGQADAMGDVITDTLELTSPADAISVTVTLFSADTTTSPQLRAVSAITALRSAPVKSVTPYAEVWGKKTLAVPKLSMMVYPDSGATWSAPTSTSMLLGFFGIESTPPTAAQLSSDVVYGGPGNDLFDTAFATAAANGGLHSMVTKLTSFAQVEPLIAQSIPAAIVVSYGAGELDGAPLESTHGHVLVVKGFTSTGAVIVNDPAFASDATVETTYDRVQLTAAWRRAGGTTYLVWPEGKTLPADPLGAY
jgi:hypothetical protein